jgi:SAM-dependent methyltransferase
MLPTKLGMSGLAPTVLIKKTERAKYEEMWQHDEYRKVAPGELLAAEFLRQAKPYKGETIIDFGCGTGRGGLILYALGGLKPIFVDFAFNALDPDILEESEKQPDKWKFIRHDLSKWPYPMELKGAKYGYCTDVMEHIPPEQVTTVLKNVLRSARHVFFSISTEPDNCGAMIGEQLHMTVRPFDWWLEKFRDLQCNIHWTNKSQYGALFYVSAFATAADMQKVSTLNVEDQTIYDNVLANLRLNLQEVCPHDTQDIEIMVLGGGPSLKDFEHEIWKKRQDGMYVITTNGAYNWCLEHDIKPSAQIVVDGREFNKRFVEPVMSNCRYLMGSQCHPSIAASLPKDQTLLWHAGASPKVRDAIDAYVMESGANREWYPIYGGSTVMLRAIPLLRTLGFRKMHIYGFDSCLRGEEHHAYTQTENDGQRIVEVVVGGRKFYCTSWMWEQAHEFMGLTRMIAEVCDLEVYGDGLIAHIISTSAELPPRGDVTPIETKEDDDNGSISLPALQRSKEVPAQRDGGP